MRVSLSESKTKGEDHKKVHTGDGQLALTLQESSVCADELVRLY